MNIPSITKYACTGGCTKTLYRRLSALGHPAAVGARVASRYVVAAWGCGGLSPLRSATPCPIAFPGQPFVTSRATDARYRSLSRWGKGFAPAPLPVFGLFRPRPALHRDGGGKLPIRIKHRIVFLEPSTLATSTKGGDVVLVFLVRLNRAAFYPVSPHDYDQDDHSVRPNKDGPQARSTHSPRVLASALASTRGRALTDTRHDRARRNCHRTRIFREWTMVCCRPPSRRAALRVTRSVAASNRSRHRSKIGVMSQFRDGRSVSPPGAHVAIQSSARIFRDGASFPPRSRSFAFKVAILPRADHSGWRRHAGVCGASHPRRLYIHSPFHYGKSFHSSVPASCRKATQRRLDRWHHASRSSRRLRVRSHAETATRLDHLWSACGWPAREQCSKRTLPSEHISRARWNMRCVRRLALLGHSRTSRARSLVPFTDSSRVTTGSHVVRAPRSWRLSRQTVVVERSADSQQRETVTKFWAVTPDGGPDLIRLANDFSCARSTFQPLRKPHAVTELHSFSSLHARRFACRRQGDDAHPMVWVISFPPKCMDTISKKNKAVLSASRRAEAQPTATPDPVNGPIKVFRLDDVSVSLFARERSFQGRPATFFSASFSRSYKDAAGERKYTKNFDADDLGKVAELCKMAADHIDSLRHPELADLATH